MGQLLSSGEYQLDLGELYARMWEIAAEDKPDGSRLYEPRSNGTEAVKWLIADLAGTPTDRRHSKSANRALREMAYAELEANGWALRLTNTSALLLRNPDGDPSDDPISPAVSDAAGEGTGAPVDDVAVTDVVDDGDRLTLLGLQWSPWHTLEEAARTATTDPGVYVAASAGDIVYVGMAGSRRGKGVRDRLRIYSRGRGAVSGLGEAALDRALADPAWLAHQLAELLSTGPQRTQAWARAAIARADLHLCWTAAPDDPTARRWESDALTALEDVGLWNRRLSPASSN